MKFPICFSYLTKCHNIFNYKIIIFFSFLSKVVNNLIQFNNSKITNFYLAQNMSINIYIRIRWKCQVSAINLRNINVLIVSKTGVTYKCYGFPAVFKVSHLFRKVQSICLFLNPLDQFDQNSTTETNHKIYNQSKFCASELTQTNVVACSKDSCKILFPV